MNLQTKRAMNANVNAENAVVEANVNAETMNARIAIQRLSLETYRQ